MNDYLLGSIPTEYSLVSIPSNPDCVIAGILDLPASVTNPESIEERAFRSAIIAEPRKSFLWLLYADWLEEHGFDEAGTRCRERAARFMNPKHGVKPQVTIE